MKLQREPSLRTEPVVGAPLAQQAAQELSARLHQKKIEALCADVFRLTGMKLTAEDPLVLAALFQSELITAAGETASLRLQESTAKAAAQLGEAAKSAHAHTDNLAQGIAAALQQMADGAKKLGDQELITLQTRFARMASETLDQVRRTAGAHPQTNRRWRAAALLGGGLAAGLIAGVVLGKEAAHDLAAEERRLMNNGVLLDATWPTLPDSAKAMFGVAPKPVVGGGAGPTSGKGKGELSKADNKRSASSRTGLGGNAAGQPGTQPAKLH